MLPASIHVVLVVISFLSVRKPSSTQSLHSQLQKALHDGGGQIMVSQYLGFTLEHAELPMNQSTNNGHHRTQMPGNILMARNGSNHRYIPGPRTNRTTTNGKSTAYLCQLTAS